MVCLPCIVVPVLLWIFHKFIRPFISMFWNSSIDDKKDGTITGPPEGVAEDDPHYKHIMERINANPVMVFSKTTCGFCQSAKGVFDKAGVVYEVEELDEREDGAALQDMLSKITGQKTVPRIFIGGKIVGGASELKQLRNEAKLLPMVKEANAKFTEGDSKKEN